MARVKIFNNAAFFTLKQTINQLKNGAAILLPSLILALLLLSEPQRAYLQLGIFLAAALLGALVAFVRLRDKKTPSKNALFAGALVGFLGALVVFLFTAVVL